MRRSCGTNHYRSPGGDTRQAVRSARHDDGSNHDDHHDHHDYDHHDYDHDDQPAALLRSTSSHPGTGRTGTDYRVRLSADNTADCALHARPVRRRI